MFKKNNKKQEETINKIEQNKSTSSKADGQETDKNNWGIAYIVAKQANMGFFWLVAW